MKTILLWDPRFPDRRPARLTVEDTVASAAVRAGVAAAANPSEAGALSAGGVLDPTMLTEVVLQHGNGGATRRVFLPYSVVMVGALAGVLASIGTPIAGGITPTPSPTPTPGNRVRMGQVGFNSIFDHGQGPIPSYLWLNRMKTASYNGVWNNGAPLSDYAYPTALGTGGADTATFLALRRPASGTIRYILRHNGVGLLWSWVAEAITVVDSSNPNRVVFDVGPAADTSAVLSITGATSWPDYKPNNPLATRDGIVVVEEALEASFLAGEKFYPQALAAVSNYWVFRSMQVQKTNNSQVRALGDRTPVGNCSYSEGSTWGYPLEEIIDLCNQAKCGLWCNAPYRAPDDYMTWFYTTLRDRLDPSLMLIPEKGNEPWNFAAGFNESFAWFEQVGQGLKSGYGNPEGYGYAAAQNAIKGRAVFGAQASRLHFILNVQADSTSNYERVFQGVEFAGYAVPALFDGPAIASYTSGGIQKLALGDDQGGTSAMRQLIMDEVVRYEATGATRAQRTVRQELIDQMRHGNAIPGWPADITLDQLGPIVDTLAAMCRARGIRHVLSYEGQDFHCSFVTLGDVDGLRANTMMEDCRNDIRVSGQQTGSYMRDKYAIMQSRGLTTTAILTDLGPLDKYGSWRTKAHYFSADTRSWSFYSTYQKTPFDTPLFEINLVGSLAGNVGRPINLAIRTFGGQFPSDAPYLKSGTLPEGVTLADGVFSGSPAQTGSYPVVFAAIDGSGREITKAATFVISVAAVGARYWRVRAIGPVSRPTNEPYATNGIPPSLASLTFNSSDGSSMPFTGATATGDQFNSSEGVANLIDADMTTVWTGMANKENVINIDFGAGNASKPSSVSLTDRASNTDRALGDFEILYSYDGSTYYSGYRTITKGGSVPGNAIYVGDPVYGGSYTDHVFTVPILYQ